MRSPPIEVARSGEETAEETEKVGGEDKATNLRSLAPLLDRERIYFELLRFKRTKNYTNLSFNTKTLRKVIEAGNCEVLCPEGQLPPVSFNGLRRVEDITVAVLQKYTAASYDRNRRAWERENLQLLTLTGGDSNISFERYILKVKKSDSRLCLLTHTVYVMLRVVSMILKSNYTRT